MIEPCQQVFVYIEQAQSTSHTSCDQVFELPQSYSRFSTNIKIHTDKFKVVFIKIVTSLSFKVCS